MKKVLAFMILFLLISSTSFSGTDQLIGARHPALSPDGKMVAFSYMGDIWVVSVNGGRAMQITNHEAYDSHPIWSPDGKFIAFCSDRNKNNDVFLISANGGEAQQITFHTNTDIPNDFSPDGKSIIFRSNRSSMAGLFMIPAAGGNARPLLDGYWNWAYHGKLDKNGKELLFVAGMENNYWWRRGYRGSNTTKIWLKNIEQNSANLVLADSCNAFWPNFSPDNEKIYFVSDRVTGVKNIWSVSGNGTNLTAITNFSQKDVTFLSVARDVPLATYERDFKIWLTNLDTGESHAIHVEAPNEPKENQTMKLKNESVSEFKVSPDGKKIAAIVRGDIFITSAEGGYARNITRSPWRERDVFWDSESRNVFFVSDKSEKPEIYSLAATGNAAWKQLTHTTDDIQSPALSPDGKWIAYFHGKRELRLMKTNGSGDRLIFQGDFGGRFGDELKWSPDSKYIAATIQRFGQSDIVAINISSGEEILLTNTAYDEESPLWSPDGKFLLFSSNRYGHSFPEFTGKWDIYQLNFEPIQPEFEEEIFEKLFESKIENSNSNKKKEKSKKESRPKIEVKFKLEDIDKQTRPVTNTLGNDRQFVLFPADTSTVFFVSNIDGKNHLWQTSLEEKKREKIKPFMANITNPRNLQFDDKGKNLYYLANGKIGKIEVKQKKSSVISFNHDLEINKIADYQQMLTELFYTLQFYFYDESHHKVNWRKIYEEFKPVLKQVRQEQDFYDYANEMIGYLNSSHTGIRGPSGELPDESSLHVGIIWQFSPDKITVAKILKSGPAYLHRDSVRIGDELIAINGKKVNANENLYNTLKGKLDQRLKLTFRSKAEGKEITIALKPISASQESRLLLEEWIEKNKQIVKEKTDDQIAYIYMRAMGQGDLSRFLKELERDGVNRKGLILDLRYNFGGNVHDRVLQALTKPVYAKWKIRGLSESPQSTFGFADKPVVLLINEVTLSDGEMTTNGFKELKRGPVVGNTTYGWLIFTTSVRLMNGGSFRLPFWGCYTLDGKDLETIGGIKPDIFVSSDLNDNLNDRDPQLDKAIEVIKNLVK